VSEFLQVVPIPIALILAVVALFFMVLACLPTKGVEYVLAKLKAWRAAGHI
jgi:hypothetical protein